MTPTVADVRACIGKTKWHHEKSARYALASLRTENPGVFSSMVRPYRCRKCRRWHLGRGQ